MARNGSGTMTRVSNSFSQPVTNTTISPTDADALFDDYDAELTNSVALDGQSVMTGQFKAANGTVGAPGYTFGSDLDCGMYRIGANNLGLSIGGSKIIDYGAASVAFSIPLTVTNATLTTPTFTAPILGTPASGDLTNCTIPVTQVSNLSTGMATFLANASSANLRGTLTDETGTGSAVFANTPTLVTPVLGTPTSGTLTSCTGLPIATGVSGLGTGIATALAVNTGSAGAPVLFNGALGTPSSGTLTSATGLPISTGVSGLGTNVATALGVNVGSAGAFVTFNGALGTPSSGTLTNCTIPITQVSSLSANMATFLGTASSANLRATLTDETGTGSAVFATSPAITTPDIIGTTAAGNANAGSLGEFVSSIIASGSAVSLTTATAVNLTSISLTAGDWDVWMTCMYTAAATTNITQLLASLSTTSATISLLGDRISATTYGSGGVVPGIAHLGSPLIQCRINVSGTTTIYGIMQPSFTVSTLTGWGSLQARRVR